MTLKKGFREEFLNKIPPFRLLKNTKLILAVPERFMTVSVFKKVTNGHETVENANGTFMQMSGNGERL